MSFYTEIQSYFEYLHTIRRLKGYISIDLKFPSKWMIPKSVTEDGQIVSFDADDTNLRGISFVSKMEESEMTTTLNKINKIIKLNKERELKEKLFKETVEQLKQTFEKTDLTKLRNLYFDFDIEPTLNTEDQDGEETTTVELAEK